MKLKHKRKKTIPDLIVEAMKKVKEYPYRSAMGLSKQTGIPLEPLEYYLIKMAQEGLVTVGRDQEDTIWVQLGGPDDNMA